MVSSQISKSDVLKSNQMKKGQCLSPPSPNDIYGEGYHDYALRSVRRPLQGCNCLEYNVLVCIHVYKQTSCYNYVLVAIVHYTSLLGVY